MSSDHSTAWSLINGIGRRIETGAMVRWHENGAPWPCKPVVGLVLRNRSICRKVTRMAHCERQMTYSRQVHENVHLCALQRHHNALCALQRHHNALCALQRHHNALCVLQRHHNALCVLQRHHNALCVLHAFFFITVVYITQIPICSG